MWRLLILALVLTLGCDEAVAGPDGGSGDAGFVDGGGGSVGGVVLFEDRPYDEDGFTGEIVAMPARGVTVELWANGAEVAAAQTDERGRFTFIETHLAPGATVTVRALADATYRYHSVRVRTPETPRSPYAVETAATVGDSDVSLLARYEDGLGGAFNVADVVYQAFVVYAPQVMAIGPTLTFVWEPGYAFPCGSCYDSDTETISLGGQPEDTDEYDDHIVLHELGHYFVEHYSRDTSPGGRHRDMQVAPELAYGEGLAYFFAAMVHGSPVIVDTYEGATRVTDLENVTLDGASHEDFLNTATGGLEGDLREEIVGAILWDAFDAPTSDEGFDGVALGVTGQLELLIDHLSDGRGPDYGAPGADLADYLHALECAAGVAAADVQSLADDRAFPYVAGGGC